MLTFAVFLQQVYSLSINPYKQCQIFHHFLGKDYCHFNPWKTVNNKSNICQKDVILGNVGFHGHYLQYLKCFFGLIGCGLQIIPEKPDVSFVTAVNIVKGSVIHCQTQCDTDCNNPLSGTKKPLHYLIVQIRTTIENRSTCKR